MDFNFLNLPEKRKCSLEFNEIKICFIKLKKVILIFYLESKNIKSQIKMCSFLMKVQRN